MKPRLLYMAAKVANKERLTKKRYLLAAVAKRADGTVVVSVNHDTIGKNPAHHAEARVLRKSDKGTTLYVARVSRMDGSWQMAKPCVHCQALIRHYGVKEVYYTIGPNEYGRYLC